MILADRLTDRLNAALFPWAVEGGTSSADEFAFREQCATRFDWHARVMAGTAAVFVLAFWPGDMMVLRRLPEAVPMFVEWRLWAAGPAALYVLLPRGRFVRRHVVVLFALFCATAFFFVGRANARLGGEGLPYLQLCFVLPFISIPLPLRFLPRAAVTSLLGLAVVAGIFLPHPVNRDSAFAMMFVAQFSSTVSLSLIFGHLLLLVLRQNFLLARELGRRAAALAAQGEALETTVAERTYELRHLTAYIETAQEVERTRIARDLHDALGQELAALSYALWYTRGKYADEPGDIGPNLEDLDDLVTRTASTTREIISELRPRILDDLGFLAAAQWLVERVAERSGLACEWLAHGDAASVGAEPSTAAFRILQESLTNVVKHASARRVTVSVDIGVTTLEMRIADDGIGIASPTVQGAGPGKGTQVSTRFGLVSMRERAGILGGTLSVATRPEGGTEVCCRIPLGAAEVQA